MGEEVPFELYQGVKVEVFPSRISSSRIRPQSSRIAAKESRRPVVCDGRKVASIPSLPEFKKFDSDFKDLDVPVEIVGPWTLRILE